MLSARMKAELACVMFDDDTPRNHSESPAMRYASHKGELVAYVKSAPALWDADKLARGLFLSEVETPLKVFDSWGEPVSGDVAEKRRVLARARRDRFRAKQAAK